MEDKMIELLEKVKEFKEEAGINDASMTIELASFQNTKTTQNILDNLDQGKTIEDAFNEEIRSYENALAKCLEVGASANNEFVFDFTLHYINTVLSIVSNLCLVEDLTKNKDNVEFLKEKIKGCLKYVDRL